MLLGLPTFGSRAEGSFNARFTGSDYSDAKQMTSGDAIDKVSWIRDGKLLAEQSFKLLLKCKTVTQLIAEAKLEWPQMPQAAAAPSRSKVKAV